MNEQEFAWQSEFGNEYINRNRVNWLLRVPFWTDIVAATGIRSVIEAGCNFGPNLLAIRLVCPFIWLGGIDVNTKAVAMARNLGLDAERKTLNDLRIAASHPVDGADLVFTAGVLIHVAPENLSDAMQTIVKASRRYVMAIEYSSNECEEIPYRGLSGMLWKRPYGQMYQEMGLRPVWDGEADGFDRCHFWLLEKP